MSETEIPARTNLTRESKKDGEITWRSAQGEEVILVRKGPGERGVLVTFQKGIILDIEKKMEEMNKYGDRNHQVEEGEEDSLSFLLEPNNNPNLQWRDLGTQIDMWLNPPKWMK